MSTPQPRSPRPSVMHRCVTAFAPTPDRRGALRLATVIVLLSLVLLAGAVPASARSTQYAFTITGHGWGHGVGMSQWGAYGYAKHGAKYGAILKHYYTGITLSKVGNVVVRVNLRSGQKAIKLSCPKDYTAQGTGAAWTIPGGTTSTVTYVGGKYRVVAGSTSRTFAAAPTFRPTAGTLRVLTKTDLGRTGAYRGAIRVIYRGGLVMVNHIPLESYLRGVVPHEVSPSWPREAVKAQACAARAYAIRSRQSGKDWDVYCDVRDQAYAGVAIEDPRSDLAVRETAGVCPAYGGEPIVATYFSCSGGHTESVKNVWGGSHPYLKGVKDPYDYYGTLHDWGPLRRTPSQIGGPLGAAGTVRAVYTVERGVSPRIVKAAVIGSGGTRYVDGSSLRTKLGLNSSWAIFRSMGISPAARDAVSIVAGSRVTLTGRTYPALSAGATVTLNFFYDGRWRSRSVPTERKVESLPDGYKARYSQYTASVSPKQTTRYYFSSGKAKSPVTTITVR